MKTIKDFTEQMAQLYFGVSLDRLRYIIAAWPLVGTETLHGPDHWARVSRNAQHILTFSFPHQRMALLRGVKLFALMHDCQRLDEGYDTMHGAHAAAFLRTHFTTICPELSPELIERVAMVCQEHTIRQPWDCYAKQDPELQILMAICLDADRLDLTRLRINPNPKFLFTSTGKDYARQPFPIPEPTAG